MSLSKVFLTSSVDAFAFKIRVSPHRLYPEAFSFNDIGVLIYSATKLFIKLEEILCTNMVSSSEINLI